VPVTAGGSGNLTLSLAISTSSPGVAVSTGSATATLQYPGGSGSGGSGSGSSSSSSSSSGSGSSSSSGSGSSSSSGSGYWVGIRDHKQRVGRFLGDHHGGSAGRRWRLLGGRCEWCRHRVRGCPEARLGHLGERKDCWNRADSNGSRLLAHLNEGDGLFLRKCPPTMGRFAAKRSSRGPFKAILPDREPGVGTHLISSDRYRLQRFGNAHKLRVSDEKYLVGPLEGLKPTSNGKGYWVVSSKGAIYTFGKRPLLPAQQYKKHLGGSHDRRVRKPPRQGRATGSSRPRGRLCLR